MATRWYVLPLAASLALAACAAPSPSSVSLGARSYSETDLQSESVQKSLESRDTDELTYDPQLTEEGLFPGPPPGDLGNFGEVNERLFRGARPTEKGIQMLKEKGVNLIINLENNKRVVDTEHLLAQKYGLKFKSIPLGIFLPPKMAKVDDFLSTVADPANGKVYFHCMQGRDRTGTMAFCHRVKVDGWDTKKAYDEMKSYKFHTYLLGLNLFVHWYGGKYGPSAPKTKDAALAY
jgi:protein tyrosine phosphatase (PTP) superfamily phosphohydrolase (DUF442 family)